MSETFIFCINFMQLFFFFLNSVLANSVDPNQAGHLEQSDLGLHCLRMPFCQEHCCTKF